MKAFVITMLVLQIIGAAVSIFRASAGDDLPTNITAGVIQVGLAAWAVVLLGGM